MSHSSGSDHQPHKLRNSIFQVPEVIIAWINITNKGAENKPERNLLISSSLEVDSGEGRTFSLWRHCCSGIQVIQWCLGEHELRKWDINGSSLFLGRRVGRPHKHVTSASPSGFPGLSTFTEGPILPTKRWLHCGPGASAFLFTGSWADFLLDTQDILNSFLFIPSGLSLSLSLFFLLHYEACGLPRSITQSVKNLPAVQETWLRFLSQEDPLEKKKATLSSFLTWKISWTEEFCGLQLMGSQRVGHNWVTNTFWGMWDLNSLAKHWNPCPTAVEAWSLNHWTTREVPRGVSFSHLQIEFGLNGTWEWAGGRSWGWLKWEIWWQAGQWHHSEWFDNSRRVWTAVLWTSESSPHLISQCSYEESTSIFPNRLNGNFDKFARFV